MAQKYCLTPKLLKIFNDKVDSGELNPAVLGNLDSKPRRELFKTFLNETDAKNINALFEKQKLAKDQWKGYIKWVKEVNGLTPQRRNDLLAKVARVAKDNNFEMMTPDQIKNFNEDLASSRIGVDVTFNEVKKLAELSKKISSAEEVMKADVTNEVNRIAYGNAVLDMYDYTAGIKPGKGKWEKLANVLNVPRAIMSTLDFSAPFRQGFGMVGSKAFWKNLEPMFKAAFNEKYYRNLQAEIISRPTYKQMQRDGLKLSNLGDKLSQREEAYMTDLVDKIPGVRGSERAYVGFLSKLRADAYDDLLLKAAMAGEDTRIGSQVSKDLANMVNNFTGSGKLFSRYIDTGAAPLANAAFFSPRKIAATIQMFNPYNYLSPTISKTAKIAALQRLAGMVGVSTSIIALARMAGADYELDPRSSDFGKVIVGDTRIDVSGGNANYLTLIARLATNQTKSTTSDIVRNLGEDFGAPNRLDTFVKYFRNKLSPVASYLADMAAGSNAMGEDFKPVKGAIERMYPLIINNTIEGYMNGGITPAAINLIADSVGFGSQTYNNAVDWNNSTGKELLQFKSKVSPEKFAKANEEYNTQVNEKLVKLIADKRYQDLSPEDKLKTLTKMKTGVKDNIYKKYGFTYKQTKAKPNPTINSLAK